MRRFRKAKNNVAKAAAVAAGMVALWGIMQKRGSGQKESARRQTPPPAPNEDAQENFKKGKQLFFKYRGNLFYMGLDEVYDEYNSYGISKQQEKIWQQEIYNAELKKLQKRETTEPFFMLLERAVYHRDRQKLAALLAVALTFHEWANSFRCLVLLEAFPGELLKAGWNTPEVKQNAGEFIAILQTLKKQVDDDTFTYDKRWEKSQKNSFPPAALKRRADKGIWAWEKLQSSGCGEC